MARIEDRRLQSVVTQSTRRPGPDLTSSFIYIYTNAVNFDPFLQGIANFNFSFESRLSVNFVNLDASHAVFTDMLNFLFQYRIFRGVMDI